LLTLAMHDTGALRQGGKMSHIRAIKIVLMADDDPDDFFLVKEAWEKTGIPLDLRRVSDGAELMDYLNRRGKYADLSSAPTPSLILLDLNMPRKDGREVLAELKSDGLLKLIPVVVLTTSDEEMDIVSCYSLGASSYLTKPSSFDSLVNILNTLGKYWLKTVRLPLLDKDYFPDWRSQCTVD
jgi:CheY-like chemotaxis protein